MNNKYSFNLTEKNKKIAQIVTVLVITVLTGMTTNSAVQTISESYREVSGEANSIISRVSKSETLDGKKKLPIYCVETEEKKVAISFDAAWGADDTDDILNILENEGVRATFFLCGYWVDKYPEEIKKIYNAGHDIGNHGNTHAHSSSLNKEKNKEEIYAVHEKIKTLLGIDMNLFRPPYGEYNDTVIESADELNYYTIQWDIDSHDWMNKGVEYEINQVLNHPHLGNGSIVLFHNDAKDTPKALTTIIKGIKSKGFEIVPISELIIEDNFYMDTEGRQISK